MQAQKKTKKRKNPWILIIQIADDNFFVCEYVVSKR